MPTMPPTSIIEIPAGGVSSGSFKAGEYNGLEKEGGFALGNIDMRGGTPYIGNGIFRFRPDGAAERGLAVLEVQRSGFRTISPAPKDFRELTR